jgi:hypothetical protein
MTGAESPPPIPTWLDATGRPVPTYPCFTCGEPHALGIVAGQDLRVHGWRPLETTTSVGSCGHPQERLPLPLGGDRWRLIPVWAPARDRVRAVAVGPTRLLTGLSR